MNLLLIASLLILVCTFIILNSNHILESKKVNELKVYQGPVPQGYNESYFRETGKTIKNITFGGLN